MPPVVPRRAGVTPNDAVLDRQCAEQFSQPGLVRLCAASFVAYCSYAICRTPLLPVRESSSWRKLTILESSH